MPPKSRQPPAPDRRQYAPLISADESRLVTSLSSGGARAAAVLAVDTAFAEVLAEHTAVVPEVLPYQPGEFFLRELPPLRAVLDGVRGLSLLVIDGYADLDPAGRPGLGAYVHAEFGVPVIGVAKSAFRTATSRQHVRRQVEPVVQHC